MRKIIYILSTSVLTVLGSCNDSGTYGPLHTLNGQNVQNASWIEKTFPRYVSVPVITDTTTISIRVSRKNVMKGFINTGDSTQQAFAKLLNVFSGFRNADHNTQGTTEYRFFNGDNAGELSTPLNGARLFDPNEYTSGTNNLHTQFQKIATEITTSKNKCYVIFSDGETSIRKEQTLNTDEMTSLKNATKQILEKSPTTQIGILSLKAGFNGNYVYDLNRSKSIRCQRYIYAICFFDKMFLPEFNRFCELNESNGGSNFLFNPQFSLNDYETTYKDTIDGQPNIAADKYYAAFPVVMTGQTITYDLKNSSHLKSVHIPTHVQRDINKYEQIDSFKMGNPTLIDSRPIMLFSNQNFDITGLENSCLIKVDFSVNFNQPSAKFVPSALLTQDINDNRLQEVANISASETLKTEGLADMFDMILQALHESKKSILLSNFIQLGKFN